MKQGNRALAILGIILIALQIVSFVGISKVYVGLYPDNDDLLYPTYHPNGSELNIKKVMFATTAGIDRFSTSFEDLLSNPDEYRVMTATQMASAMVRESLGCSDGGSIGLVVYDTILTISYCAVGIAGIITLLISSLSMLKAKRKHTHWQDDPTFQKTM